MESELLQRVVREQQGLRDEVLGAKLVVPVPGSGAALTASQIVASSVADPAGSPLSVALIETLLQSFYYASGYVSAVAQHTNAIPGDTLNSIGSDFGDESAGDQGGEVAAIPNA